MGTIRSTVRRITRAALALGLAALAPSAAHAQQPLFAEPLFAPPPTVVDYARYYTRTEDCLAAVRRVRDSAHWGGVRTTGDPTRWQAVLAALDPRQPEPAAVAATAQRCGARFPVASAAEIDLLLLQELSFYTGTDSLLDAVLARRLALLPADAAVTRPNGLKQNVRADTLARVLDFALQEARPARVAWVERRLADLAQLGPSAAVQRAGGYNELKQFAAEVGDTGLADRYQRAWVALWDSIVASVPQTEQTRTFTQRLRSNATDYERQRALARGKVVEPLAVASARAAALAQGRALDPADSVRAAAVLAPLIEAPFWFRRADSTMPRPTRGTLGLVVFVEGEWCRLQCYTGGHYAVLRALHERFGAALEITLVTHTHGFFRNFPPLAPAEEAERVRQFLFEHLELPGALAVEPTPFSQLPAPDGRRVDQPPATVTRYRPRSLMSAGAPALGGLAQGHGVNDVSAFLVDPQGQLLLQTSLNAKEHRTLLAIIAGQLARSAPKS